MLKTLWFLLIAFAIAASLAWVLDNNGLVVITWLGYETKTDILTALLLSFLFTILIILLSYFVAKILVMKFPNLFQVFFKKTRLKKLEQQTKKHWEGLDVMTQLLMAIETSDFKSLEKLQNKLSTLVKTPGINNFLSGKIAFIKKDYALAAEFFSKIEDDQSANIMVLRSKFRLALEKGEEETAIAYAKQVLAINRGNADMAQILLSLYKKQGLWKEAKELVKLHDIEQFKDELQKKDTATVNTALALEHYQNKQFSTSVKYAKIALKAETNFLPAVEILLKSWIKQGMSFKAKWMIKRLWKEDPHLILAEIFDLIHRKSSAKDRIASMKKLSSLNKDTHLGNLAVGFTAFKTGNYEEAKEFLRLSVLKERTYRAYKLLSYIERILGNNNSSEKYLAKTEMLNQNDHYYCSNCQDSSAKWSAKCTNCNGYDCLEWDS